MLKSSLRIISLFYTSIPCHVFGRLFFFKLSSCTCAVLVSAGFFSRMLGLRWQPSDAHCSQLCRWTLKRSFLVFDATLCGPNLASQRRCLAFDDKQSRCHVSVGISPTSLCRCLRWKPVAPGFEQAPDAHAFSGWCTFHQNAKCVPFFPLGTISARAWRKVSSPSLPTKPDAVDQRPFFVCRTYFAFSGLSCCRRAMPASLTTARWQIRFRRSL